MLVHGAGQRDAKAGNHERVEHGWYLGFAAGVNEGLGDVRVFFVEGGAALGREGVDKLMAPLGHLSE